MLAVWYACIRVASKHRRFVHVCRSVVLNEVCSKKYMTV